MGRNRESRTGIAVLAFIVASAAAQFNSPAGLRGDCTDKTDGIYPTDHCSTYFLECSGGTTTKQNCSAGLWFNPISSQCDYRENIVSCQDPFSCVGRSDGIYGEGCSSLFWFCSGGQLRRSSCPDGLFFNVEAQTCDFSEKIRACGDTRGTDSSPTTGSTVFTTFSSTGSQSVVTEQPSLVVRDTTEVPYGRTYPTYAPRQRISGIVSKTPLPESTAGTACAGKEDGSHAVQECSQQYVLCWAGTGQIMNCQQGLKFNEVSGQCDYPEKVVGCSASRSASLQESDSSVYGGATAPVSDTPIASLPIPRQPADFDCSSRPNGLYSRGCVAEFYQCSSGVTYHQKCPEGLVFDDLTKGCDYIQICSAPTASAVQDVTAGSYSGAPSTVIPTTVTSDSFDCSSRVDGSYSEGCVSEFIQCVSGMAYPVRCPDGLVFDGVSQSCNYPQSCGQPRPLEEDNSVYKQPQSLSPTQSTFDCSTQSDGMYGVSCSHEFVHCVSGMSYSQKCPSGLVFDKTTGICDYPEKCVKQEDAVEVPVVLSPTVQSIHPTLTPDSMDCLNRADGMYSTGCSRSYVQCANGMTFNGLCSEGLVFIQETGRCDYATKCGDVSLDETATSIPSVSSTSSSPYKPLAAKEIAVATPSVPPMRDGPSGILIDCTTLSDGSYTSGCTHAFVKCVSGNAMPLECPAGLVFDKRVDQCVWPEDCSSDTTVTLPTVVMPTRPSDAPSTVYDMNEEKEEKEEMVTDAPLPQVNNDGSVCTGTGRRAMGKCSSGFVQCIGGKMIARRCPGQSLFDEKIGLCVYDLEGCEMDVDDVEETGDASTVSPQLDTPSTGYSSEAVQNAASYYEQTTQQTVYQQYPQSIPPQPYQQNGYEAPPEQDYHTGYPSRVQDVQYQSAEYQSVPQSPMYSSFGDSSLPSQSLSPECDIDSFRRVSACSSSFDFCSPTARQWIRKVCGKSHRFDSSANKCRPIFEVRECDEPMSSYVPPPVQSESYYPDPASSLDYGVPLSGRNYEEKHVVDPFKGGYQSGRMGSNPFLAIGNTGSFYTDDGSRWVGSAWSEGGNGRGARRRNKDRHHSGNVVIVSGNPFGAGRDRTLNDEWNGRRSMNGPVRSSLTDERRHGVRNVEDNFNGHIDHFAPPLSAVNPFAVKRADGHRRRGRKSCRRDKHGRREDWEEEDCEEKTELIEKERPTASTPRHVKERPMKIEEESVEEENEKTESMEESAHSEAEEKEVEQTEDNEEIEETEDDKEETESDPEMTRAVVDDEDGEETGDGVNEVEEKGTEETSEETVTENGSDEEMVEKMEEEKNEDDEDSEDGKELEETEVEDPEETEKTEQTEEVTVEEGKEESSDTAETEKEDEDEDEDEEVNEDTEALEENGDSESAVESKTDDMDTPESLENEEKTIEGEETSDAVEETQKEEEKEEEGENEGEKTTANEENPIEKNEEIESGEVIDEEEEEGEEGDEEVKEDGNDNEETNETNEDEEEKEKETAETVEQSEVTEDEKLNEETDVNEEEEEVAVEDTKDGVDGEEGEEGEEPEDQPESIENGSEKEEETTESKEEDEEENGIKEEDHIGEEMEKEDESEDGDGDGEEVEEDGEIIDPEENDKTEQTEDVTVEEGKEESPETAETENEDEDEEEEEEVNEMEADKESSDDKEMATEESKVVDVESPESIENGQGNIEMKYHVENGKVDKEKTVEEMEGEELNDEEESDETAEEVESEEPEDGSESDGVVEEGEDNENRRSRRSIVYDTSASTQSGVSGRVSLSLPRRRSSRLHSSSRFSRLCASATAGQTISIGQCRQDFVYCKSTRRPVVAACPVGDLFDAVSGSCVPTEICGAEKAKMDIASVTQSTPTSASYIRQGENPTMPLPTWTTTHKPDIVAVVSEDSECSSLSDGAYPLSDCSSEYFVCAASVKHIYKCPDGLIYHKKNDACDWPADVPACGITSTDATALPVRDWTNKYGDDSVKIDSLAATVSPMHVHFDCIKDGGFAIDCKGGFVMCSNGQASFMKCQPGLVFEEASQSCQYPSHVGSCGLSPVTSLDVSTTTSSAYTAYTAYTSTSAPVKPVEVLVNTPVDKNACSGVSNGLEGATRDCPSSFVICEEGQVTAVMNCPDGTFFDDRSKNCEYREIACTGGWNGEADGVETPVGQDVSEEYGRRASRPYRPMMPVAVEKIEKIEKIEKQEETRRDESVKINPVIVPSTVEPAPEATCDWKGAAPSGSCTSQFVICSNGKPSVFDCSAGLVFSQSTSACEYPEFVSGCPQFVVKSSTTVSPMSDAVIVDQSEYSRDESPSTTTMRPILPVRNGEHTSTKFEPTGDHCTFQADRPSFPLNYCSMTYAVCTSQGMAFKTNCTFGFLFDSVIRRCVPSEHCGQSYLKDIAGAPSPAPLHSIDWVEDSRCVGVKDGTLKPTDVCSRQYIRCDKETVVMESCSIELDVFSPTTGRCVMRVQMAECASSTSGSTPAITLPKKSASLSPSSDVSSSSYSTVLPPSHRGARIRGGLPVASSPALFDARTFCTTKHSDGLYRNPENCAGIVQCFDGEAFSYPSCAPGLFFNEEIGQCDYASNVHECASQADIVALVDSSTSCKGQPHGAHLADDSDCSIYYRCVWGSVEKLTCPTGTVFNARLSVCDYPSEVPRCQKQ